LKFSSRGHRATGDHALTATNGATSKHVLVLGGGFAGVQAAIALRKTTPFAVTLVSDRDYLFLFPTSIWIPTREMPFEKAQVSLEAIRKRHGFRLVIDTVQEIRSAENKVVTSGGEYAYDYLVVATGAEKMRQPGIEHTLSICGKPDSSVAIRDRLDALLEKGGGSIAVGFGGNPKDKSAVRGGPAFELLFNLDHFLRRRRVRDRFTLTFFAPMPEPGERMGSRALTLMERMFRATGIARRVGTRITGFDPTGVAFEDGSRLDADLVLFIPGATGHPLMARSDLPLNDAGFVRIDDTGLVEGTTNVYAAGDVAALDGPEWRAKQGHTAEVMARNVAFNIAAVEAGRPERRGYQAHLSIICLMDTGNGAAFVYRGRKHNYVIPLPVVGHWMKRGWGTYARLTKVGRFPRLPGL
jgi:sulfide:quinone oxidoreductase